MTLREVKGRTFHWLDLTGWDESVIEKQCGASRELQFGPINEGAHTEIGMKPQREWALR